MTRNPAPAPEEDEDFEVEDADINHIAHCIQEGQTDGVFTLEDGTEVIWELNIQMKL